MRVIPILFVLIRFVFNVFSVLAEVRWDLTDSVSQCRSRGIWCAFVSEALVVIQLKLMQREDMFECLSFGKYCCKYNKSHGNKEAFLMGKKSVVYFYV